MGYMPRHIATPLINDGVLVEKVMPDDKHGAQSAINKQVLPERQHATELGFISDDGRVV